MNPQTEPETPLFQRPKSLKSFDDGQVILSQNPSLKHVLSDVMMPQMSGLQLADQLKADHPDISIVLMTGYSDALEGGLQTETPVVKKPFAVEELGPAFAAAEKLNSSAKKIIPLHPN
ncbi:response regulator [Rhizobium sp. P44RR-XXIV]|nr:response regulator [Rhizobium sp. P44RR-XXIV]TXH82639.1 MAG: response regulator [Rhizobium sp.]